MIRTTIGFCLGVAACAVVPELPRWAQNQINMLAEQVVERTEAPVVQLEWDGIPLIDEEHVRSAFERETTRD